MCLERRKLWERISDARRENFCACGAQTDVGNRRDEEMIIAVSLCVHRAELHDVGHKIFMASQSDTREYVLEALNKGVGHV